MKRDDEEPCNHGVLGGCEARCACGHLCRRHTNADGCTEEGAVEESRTLTFCQCDGFASQSGEG